MNTISNVDTQYFDKLRLKLFFQSLYRFSVPYIVTPIIYVPIILWMITRAKTWRVDVNISTNVLEQNACPFENQVHPPTAEHHHVILTQHSFLFSCWKAVGLLDDFWFGFNCSICSWVQLTTGCSNRLWPVFPIAVFPHSCQENPLLFQRSRWQGGKHQFWELMNQNSPRDLSVDTARFKWLTMEFTL